MHSLQQGQLGERLEYNLNALPETLGPRIGMSRLYGSSESAIKTKSFEKVRLGIFTKYLDMARDWISLRAPLAEAPYVPYRFHRMTRSVRSRPFDMTWQDPANGVDKALLNIYVALASSTCRPGDLAAFPHE